MTIICTNWGVIVVQHQRHRLVGETLIQYGIDHFIPLIESLRIVRGRRTRDLKPLLGDYVLTSISSSWRSMLSIKGVRGIMLNELGFPAQVLPFEIERMRAMCEGDVFRSNTPSVDGFAYGQKVTPKDGPFVYHVGRYDGKTKRGDSALFLLFGREQRVLFKQGDLVAV